MTRALLIAALLVSSFLNLYLWWELNYNKRVREHTGVRVGLWTKFVNNSCVTKQSILQSLDSNAEDYTFEVNDLTKSEHTSKRYYDISIDIWIKPVIPFSKDRGRHRIFFRPDNGCACTGPRSCGWSSND